MLKEKEDAIRKGCCNNRGQREPEQKQTASYKEKRELRREPGYNKKTAQYCSQDSRDKVGGKRKKVSAKIESSSIVPCDPSPRREKCLQQKGYGEIVEIKPENVPPPFQYISGSVEIMPFYVVQ